MNTHEFTGKTTQEAIDQGLNELGVTIADVRVEVLQEGAKGLFGLFGSKPAKVRITVFEEEKEEDEGLSDLLGSFSLDSNKKAKQKQQAKPAAEPRKQEKKAEAPAELPKKEERQPEAVKTAEPAAASAPAIKMPEEPKAEETARDDEPADEQVKRDVGTEGDPKPKARGGESRKSRSATEKKAKKPQEPAPAEKDDAETATEAEVESKLVTAFAPDGPAELFPEDTPAGKAQHFLIEMTKRMNVPVEVYVDENNPDSISIHMVGDTLGILIGRRGETLDALQYLTSLQVNKGQDEYIRVTVDSENYRAKREDSLRRLALRMANRAQKTGRRVVLEPMNPYERRVLHTTLQNHPAVTTHSEGEEPNRHVVIMLKTPQAGQPADEKKAQDGHGSRRKSRRRGSRKGNRVDKAPAVNDGEASVVEIVEEETEA